MRRGKGTRETNLLVSVQTPHLRNDDIPNVVLASQRNILLDLRINHALIRLERVARPTVPVRADAVERVLAIGLFEEGRQPGGALVDARLELRRDGARAAGALLVAVAGARGADFGVYGAFEVIDRALGRGMSVFMWLVGSGWEKMYPVVDGLLRRHPGLSDPRAMLEDYRCTECKARFLTGLVR